MSIASRYHTLKREISDIKQDFKLASGSVCLLGVSKTQPVSSIEELIKAGLTSFGENRVQEAESKWPELQKRYPKVELHLIGPLQTNKVKAALSLFDVIQTIDRPKLAESIAKEWTPKSRCQKFYIQVNTGNEPQKAGISPDALEELVSLCRTLRLPIVGLMCIPPLNQLPAPHFALLYTLAQRYGLHELSMGMSADYATAIRMGSTCVRIGTKLFGERNNQLN